MRWQTLNRLAGVRQNLCSFAMIVFPDSMDAFAGRRESASMKASAREHLPEVHRE